MTYNTVILALHAIKFLDLHFLYISKVLDKEKISVQKLDNTANQNNSAINSYFN